VTTAVRDRDSAREATDHVASLDSVRGLAVILVMVFHFGWTFPSATPLTAVVHDLLWTGWVGVDMFFALSGFLITRGLIAPSTRATSDRLKRFWARRFLRIFPLYYAVLIVGSVVELATHGAPPSLSYWLYFQNYAIAAEPMHQIDWTGHFWSLAIEEQFYLVWPLVMLLGSPRIRVPVTLGLFLLGATTRTFLHFRGVALFGMGEGTLEKLLYCATPTHMDGLLLGALVAMLVAEPTHVLAVLWKRLRTPIFALASLGLLATAALTARGGLGLGRVFSQYDGRVAILGYPLLAVASSSLVYALVDRPAGAPTPWPWASRALASCGKVSYGMYVFHWPVARALIDPVASAHLPDALGALLTLGFIAAGIPLTWVAAMLSFRYFETPFLAAKARFVG
jgi:peptidoglycan/LPS O-acetylase OafA/YrhL